MWRLDGEAELRVARAAQGPCPGGPTCVRRGTLPSRSTCCAAASGSGPLGLFPGRKEGVHVELQGCFSLLLSPRLAHGLVLLELHRTA